MISSITAPLFPQDAVEIIFPTKSPTSPDHLALCLRVLENLPLSIICHPERAFHEDKSPFGYYAHCLEERTRALIEAINGPAKALWAFTGGFGCVEIVERLEALNFKPSSFPKVLIGYSDITHLHALWAKWGWPSLHGPNLGNTDVTRPPETTIPININASLHDTLAYLLAPGTSLSYTLEWLNVDKSLIPASPLSAPIYGGNATLVKEMDNTSTALCLKNNFLFLEESPECPKRMNRVFTSLLRTGAFDQLAGLIFGYIPDDNLQPLPEVFTIFLRDHLSQASFPILFSPDFGHGLKNDPLPLGVTATLSFKKDQWHLDIPKNFGNPSL